MSDYKGQPSGSIKIESFRDTAHVVAIYRKYVKEHNVRTVIIYKGQECRGTSYVTLQALIGKTVTIYLKTEELVNSFIKEYEERREIA